jgi:hypothetical protein
VTATVELSREAARRFLVQRHLLSPPRSVRGGPDGVREVFGRLGSVQFDPLAVAGRNHDLVLHARVRDYDAAWTQSLLYRERELFEALNKMLSLLPTAELPWFRRTWDDRRAAHEASTFRAFRDAVEHVLERIAQRGPMSSLDFDRRRTVDWYWGPTSEVRAVLEALAESGILAIAEREGNRRYYDLVERLFPAELLAIRPAPRDQVRHKLLSRYRAHGLLGATGPYELFYGTGKPRRAPADPTDAIVRGELRDELVATGALREVRVEGVRGSRFVVGGDVPLLEAAAAAGRGDPGGPSTPPAVTLLAPLDPLVWDRDLLRSLFGFDYVWEVYVPAAKRRWGYYVLPVLFGDRLVGRIEPRIERRAGCVSILGAWWEDGFDPGHAEGFVPALRQAFADYLRFAGQPRLEWVPSLGRERRLVGVRPRPV